MAAPAFAKPQRTSSRAKWYDALGDYKFVGSLNTGQISLAEGVAQNRLDEIIDGLEALDAKGKLTEAVWRDWIRRLESGEPVSLTP